MSGTLEVQGALQAHAVHPAGANLPVGRIAWPGKQFNPGSTAWYRVSFTTAQRPPRAAIGEGAAVRHTGMLQIDVFYPKSGYGDGPVRQEAERIAAAYKSGTSLDSYGAPVRIESSAAGSVDEEDIWLRVPVRIWWRADVAN